MKGIIGKAIHWLDKLVWRVTGRQHVYHVEIWYKGGDQSNAFNSPRITGTVGVTHRPGEVKVMRAMRQYFGSRLLKKMPKSGKVNGRLVIERITYLGRF